MPDFIRLTDFEDGSPIYQKIDQICSFYYEDDETIIDLGDETFSVRETVDQIKVLIDDMKRY